MDTITHPTMGKINLKEIDDAIQELEARNFDFEQPLFSLNIVKGLMLLIKLQNKMLEQNATSVVIIPKDETTDEELLTKLKSQSERA